MWLNIACIAAGASLGAISRYGIYAIKLPNYIPTFSVNLLGCLLFGTISGLLTQNHPNNNILRLTLLVGFLGSFTTFSTYASDIVTALKNQDYLTASINLITQNTLGIAALFLGLKIASLFTPATTS